mmetsp:Transcript_15963/g.55160  ORF Transcript_15963/g.55160 Transcript_15963/m.55160 type:complete len:296 (-) Transcript_15963:375-1262(-)
MRPGSSASFSGFWTVTTSLCTREWRPRCDGGAPGPSLTSGGCCGTTSATSLLVSRLRAPSSSCAAISTRLTTRSPGSVRPPRPIRSRSTSGRPGGRGGGMLLSSARSSGCIRTHTSRPSRASAASAQMTRTSSSCDAPVPRLPSFGPGSWWVTRCFGPRATRSTGPWQWSWRRRRSSGSRASRSGGLRRRLTRPVSPFPSPTSSPSRSFNVLSRAVGARLACMDASRMLSGSSSAPSTTQRRVSATSSTTRPSRRSRRRRPRSSRLGPLCAGVTATSGTRRPTGRTSGAAPRRRT